MMNNEDLIKIIWDKEPYLKQIRGYLHQYPEVSAHEFATASFLKNEILKIGLLITEVVGTGFYVLLEGGKPGKTVALRTEIDGLPMEESADNLCGQKKWVSKNQGVSHTCGHDAHMAMMLTTISVLSEIKDSLNGNIVFLFEEGEETGSGIQAMIVAIRNLNIAAFFGMHVTSFMKSGMLCADEGLKMAGSVLVEFEIIGKGGHGSRPDLSINPLFATVQVISGITSAWSNRIDVEETVTLGLTQMHCGTANNIIAESAIVSGTLRFYDRNEALHAIEVLKETIVYTATAHRCKALTHNINIVNNPVMNDPIMSKISTHGIEELLPGHNITGVKWYASETFCNYAVIAPVCFAFLGVGNPEIGSGAEHHNIHFDIDEDALKYGVAAQVKFAIDFLDS